MPEKYLRKTLALIDELTKGVSVSTTLSFITGDATLKRDNRHLSLSFTALFSNEIANAHGCLLPAFEIKSGSIDWLVDSACGYFGGNLTYSYEKPQDLAISINRVTDKRMDENAELYYRCVFPIEYDWGMTIVSMPYNHESCTHTRSLLRLQIDGTPIDVFYCKHNNQTYMLIDSMTKRTMKDMQKVTLAVRSALGMIMGCVYGDYQYVIASDVEGFNSENTFLSFLSLKEKVQCPYMIFNTSRVELKEKLQRYEWQKYALEELEKEDNEVVWFYHEDLMPMSVPSMLADALYKDNNLLTATNLVLDTSAYTVAYQTLIYCVALEAISTSLVEETAKPVMEKGDFKRKVLPTLLGALKGIEGLDESVIDIFTKRLTNNLNTPTNQDKLTALFDKYGYELTTEDIEAIKLRNPNFHGYIIDKNKRKSDFDEFEMELFARALRLHKLCCIIILKTAGYEGYILNNEVVFGIKEACERKEPAMIKI